jgi:hypothetical protein
MSCVLSRYPVHGQDPHAHAAVAMNRAFSNAALVGVDLVVHPVLQGGVIRHDHVRTGLERELPAVVLNRSDCRCGRDEGVPVTMRARATILSDMSSLPFGLPAYGVFGCAMA